jgi:hypothetical protein
VQQLNSTIAGKSATPLGIQFGAYGAFSSFFGLAQLPAATTNFTGIVDYASSITFELVTNATVSSSSYPSNDEISVRFLFANGTTSANPLTAYPLFGQQDTVIPWNTFVTEMNKFAIGDETSWCNACGSSSTGCSSTSSSAPSGTSASSTSSSGGISRAVAGVIGAMVALAVILGIEGLVLLVTGWRLVSKKRLGPPAATVQSVAPTTKV